MWHLHLSVQATYSCMWMFPKESWMKCSANRYEKPILGCSRRNLQARNFFSTRLLSVEFSPWVVLDNCLFSKLYSDFGNKCIILYLHSFFRQEQDWPPICKVLLGIWYRLPTTCSVLVLPTVLNSDAFFKVSIRKVSHPVSKVSHD